MFAAVDADGGGTLSAAEFCGWLEEEGRDAVDRFRQGNVREDDAFTKVVTAFVDASHAAVTKLGWEELFRNYDDDGSGELEIDEFLVAVRTETKLPHSEVSDVELKVTVATYGVAARCHRPDSVASMQDLFKLIDEDNSGAISGEEFSALLSADVDETAMPMAAFEASMFELVDVWAETNLNEDWVRILISAQIIAGACLITSCCSVLRVPMTLGYDSILIFYSHSSI